MNAHGLFSKYFSESGKLVAQLFAKIEEFLEERDELVCVLLDEVESVTGARAAAVAGGEPADAVRVVNALLTRLDALRRHPNVVVLCTSNMPDAIDAAFVDRADIKVRLLRAREVLALVLPLLAVGSHVLTAGARDRVSLDRASRPVWA